MPINRHLHIDLILYISLNQSSTYDFKNFQPDSRIKDYI
jgi:hypothetical protein